MKVFLFFMSTILSALISCNSNKDAAKNNKLPLEGTWELIKGTTIQNGDTVNSNYTANTTFIKIINDTHFAFLQHNQNKSKDSSVFVAGGGKYTLNDSSYTEHLEYCIDRDWEGKDFNFIINIKNDTLIQKGIEKVESKNINRINIEEYKRVRK